MTIIQERPAKLATVPCPPWCREDHTGPDDGVHCSEAISVLATRHMRDDIDYPNEINVNVQQHPGRPPLIHLTHHDGMLDPEDTLTPHEAEQLATYLNANAATIRANRNHTCWCDGMHGPGNIHVGEMKRVFLSHGSKGYEPAVLIAIARDDSKSPDAVVHVTSHDERTADELTPDEADQLAARLRCCAATILTGGRQ